MRSRFSIPRPAIVGLALVAALVVVSSATAWRATAESGPSHSTVVTIAPQRILDTRDGTDLGLPGPFVSAISQKLQVTGSVHTANGTMQVVPIGATGVLLNVTSVRSTADGFLSVRPGDASGAPTTSSLNIRAGVTTPNAVQVTMPTTGAFAGQIDIVYDALGIAGPTTDVLVDVVGYTTTEALDDLTAEIASKADIDDVYNRDELDSWRQLFADMIEETRDEASATFVSHGEIVLSHGTANMSNHGSGGDPATTVSNFGRGTTVSGDGTVTMSFDGPATLGGRNYRLSSIEYCIADASATLGVVWISAQNTSDTVESIENRTVDGCYSVSADPLPAAQAYAAEFFVSGGETNFLTFVGMRSIWVPVGAP
jgi:hypothetical protein